MIKKTLLGTALVAAAATSHAATLLSEDFESFSAALAAGWTTVNQSSPVGLYTWGQGFSVFSAQAGSALSFAQSNWQVANEISGGAVDNWLMTPTLTFDSSNTLTFWSRTMISPSEYPDRLEVRLSTAGSSSSTASFTTLLLTINPDLTATGFPGEWTQYTVDFGLLAGTSGRIAFRTLMPDNVSYSDIVGIDTVTVTAVPEPETYAMLLLGLGAVAARIRRRNNAA